MTSLEWVIFIGSLLCISILGTLFVLAFFYVSLNFFEWLLWKYRRKY